MNIDFQFLAYVRLVGFFRDDFVKECISLGINEFDAIGYAGSEAFKRADLIQLYQDYGRDAAWFDRWIQYLYARYTAIKEATP